MGFIHIYKTAIWGAVIDLRTSEPITQNHKNNGIFVGYGCLRKLDGFYNLKIDPNSNLNDT
jgi:hypothetical protein